jgi:hypothetical protein
MYTTFEKTERAEGGGKTLYTILKKRRVLLNEHIKPETFANFKYDNSKAEELLKSRFWVVGTHVADGIASGRGH